jgi:hypothetical protein
MAVVHKGDGSPLRGIHVKIGLILDGAVSRQKKRKIGSCLSVLAAGGGIGTVERDFVDTRNLAFLDRT